MLKKVEYIIRGNLVVVCQDLFKSYRGEPPTFPGLRKPEKGKSVITLGLNF